MLNFRKCGDINDSSKSYSISSKYDLDGQQLLEAVKETFDHRKSSFTDIVAFSDEYANDIEFIKIMEKIREYIESGVIKQKNCNVNISIINIIKLPI